MGLPFRRAALPVRITHTRGEGVLSGIYQKAAFSLGGFHFQTDGFRKNADQKDNIAQRLFTVGVSPQTSIQAEVSIQRDRHAVIFNTDSSRMTFSRSNKQRRDHTFRLGGRHAFSPDSIILGSFIVSRCRLSVEKMTSSSYPVFAFIRLKIPKDAFSVELQHLFRSRYFNLTSGVGYFDIMKN